MKKLKRPFPYFIIIIFAIPLVISSSAFANGYHSGPSLMNSLPENPSDCSQALTNDSSEDQAFKALKRQLAGKETHTGRAVGAIIEFLVERSDWSGRAKAKAWEILVDEYNSTNNGHIVSYCANTYDEDVICWGGQRGSTLAFRRDGSMYRIFNENKDLPHKAPDGTVDFYWNDPDLIQIAPARSVP
ncbi:hypothetical protein GW916_10170 [bacterium]|nr:hypothetical protein [bacterium]